MGRTHHSVPPTLREETRDFSLRVEPIVLRSRGRPSDEGILQLSIFIFSRPDKTISFSSVWKGWLRAAVIMAKRWRWAGCYSNRSVVHVLWSSPLAGRGLDGFSVTSPLQRHVSSFSSSHFLTPDFLQTYPSHLPPRKFFFLFFNLLYLP
ncbi:UNVERIFIED_CONTAM: hypothetical protein Sradi_3286200 [Sesamum radiatum]|uniref:Uncharacterized protein n=1 Tax=Sesamum radiatum TaxID=300843 RepID=A0AAW2R149_SESRA